MLTREMLAANAALTGLTEAQIVAITEMSQNDENTVIGTRIGALHGQYDTDVLGITKIAKNGAEKSYDYVKRVLNFYVNEVAEHKSKIDQANKKIATLTKQIEDGEGTEALKQQIKDAKAQVSQLQAQLTSTAAEMAAKEANFQKEIKSIHIDHAFAEATKGLKFKNGISTAVQDILLKSAKAEVLAKGTPDFIDNADGSKKLVFRDANGLIINNPGNNLNPYTVSELLLETSVKDVLETKVVQTGGGTGPVKVNPMATLDLSAARTQVEADKIIEAQLLANGLTRDSVEFGDKLMQLRTENNVSSLPLR